MGEDICCFFSFTLLIARENRLVVFFPLPCGDCLAFVIFPPNFASIFSPFFFFRFVCSSGPFFFPAERSNLPPSFPKLSTVPSLPRQQLPGDAFHHLLNTWLIRSATLTNPLPIGTQKSVPGFATFPLPSLFPAPMCLRSPFFFPPFFLASTTPYFFGFLS